MTRRRRFEAITIPMAPPEPPPPPRDMPGLSIFVELTEGEAAQLASIIIANPNAAPELNAFAVELREIVAGTVKARGLRPLTVTYDADGKERPL